MDNIPVIRIKKLRESLLASKNEALEIADLLGRGDGGRELSLLITKIQEARSWGREALTIIAPGEYQND